MRRRVSQLSRLVDEQKVHGTIGIAHTRWATHGEPNTVNAHPHTDCTTKIAVVHNGIIENYATLKTALAKEGHRFTTETDSEVIAHLIEKFYKGNLEKAVAQALHHVTGTYGIAVVCSDEPAKIVGARHGSPLVVGICDDDEYILASDVSAIIRHTNQVVYLDDEEMVVLTPQGIQTTNMREEKVAKKVAKKAARKAPARKGAKKAAKKVVRRAAKKAPAKKAPRKAAKKAARRR